MNILNRVMATAKPHSRKLILAGVVLALAVAALFYIGHLRNKAQEAAVRAVVAEGSVSVLETARRSDEAALASAGASRAAILADESENRENTEAALRDHPGWATEPVPDAVLRSLQD